MEQNQKLKPNIVIIDNPIDEDTLKRNLEHLYDVMNEAIRKLPIDKQEKYFISDTKLEEMKKSEKYIFL